MWNYVKRYLHFALLAALFMIGEVMMDLIQPGIMSRIVDEGVLGLKNGGVGDLHQIWVLGTEMIGLALFGVTGFILGPFAFMVIRELVELYREKH